MEHWRPELTTSGSDEALEVPDGAGSQNRVSGILGWDPERLRWGFRRLRQGLLCVEVQMGPFRCFDGALGGLIGIWKAWMVPQEARMGVRRPRWDIKKQ